MSNNISADLELMTQECCNCEVDDEKYVVVVSQLGKPAAHYCLSCATSLHNKIDRILREVPAV